MTVGGASRAIEPESSLSLEPLYRQAMAHMQDGAWDEAEGCLSILLERHPEDGRLRSALEMAEFKAELDAVSKVRAKRWILPGFRALIPVGILAVVILLIVASVQFTTTVLRPMLSDARDERALAASLAQARGMIDGERFADARALLQEDVLAQDPENAEARGLLATIDLQEQRLDLYNLAVELMDSGDYGTATVLFEEIANKNSDFRRVQQKLAQIDDLVGMQQLFLQADLLDKTGPARRSEAIAAYVALRERNSNYQEDRVEARLIALYLAEAQDLLAAAPAAPERIPQAIESLERLIQLAPRHEEGLPLLRAARFYQTGAAAHAEADWDKAEKNLQQVVELRPDFMEGQAVEMLYEALVALGDVHRERGELTLANEYYARARALPVSDTGRADSGLAQVVPTPTASPPPVVQSAPAVYAVAAPVPPPAPAPTATPTPPPSMSSQQGRIVFRSDNPEQPGFWTMDPTGADRVYLGNNESLARQYADLYEAETRSNGRKLFVRSGGNSEQVWMAQADRSDQQITYFFGVSYDPVWSPDGQRIAFVSQEHRSDDIWVAWQDGADPRKLTDNTWEWDKHPSFSPTSGEIVFWSNRTGTKQIWVMGQDGSNQRNISNVAWDEYDPIWVK